MKRIFLFLIAVFSLSLYSQTVVLSDTLPIYIHGKVLNNKTKEPLCGATIQFFNIDTSNFKKLGTVVSNLKDGSYKTILHGGSTYCMYAENANFYPVSIIIDVSKITNRSNTEKDIYLIHSVHSFTDDTIDMAHFHNVHIDSIEIGEVIRLNNVFFDTDKSELKPESATELNRLADYLKANPSIEIEISGHTDDIGSDVYNKTLSQQRVYSVIKYLESKGVNKKRLKGVGYGKSKPINKNDSEEGRAHNRRVEFTFIKK